MDYPPLKGAALVWITLSLGLAVFMEVLDTTIANVAVPVIAGNLGAATTQGTWVITSFAVANAVSVPLTVYRRRRRFRHHIVAVRYRTQPSGFGNFPHLAGLYRRAADSLVAKPVNGILSARKTDAGTGIVGNDRRCCPCSRADTRRLDFRKLALGLDFFH